MLNRVKLSYFQQHRELEVKLGGGLTAIRGANEAGKSTLLRGICYALFGAKAMPDTLEALVTWGEDVKKLKAEVEFSADGVTYTVKRGKSGAELNYDGGRVTGQNEVTAFICRLLKTDAGAAPRLMLSNQNEIRGALEAGTKETTALIERLADFNQIDHLIDLMGERLTLGNVGPTEAAIDAARVQLEAAQAAAVAPDLGALDFAISNADELVAVVESAAEDVQKDADTAVTALNDGKVAAAERAAVQKIITEAEGRIDAIDVQLGGLREVKAPDNVEVEIQRKRDAISAEERRAVHQALKDRVAEIDGELVTLRAVVAPGGAPARLATLREQIAASDRGAELKAKFLKVQPFTASRAKGAETFRGTLHYLESQITVQRSSRAEAERLAAQATADARLLRQQVTDGSCGFCGQDFSQVAAVQAKNADLVARAEALEAQALERLQSASDSGLEQDRLQGIKEESQPALAALAVVGADYAALADDVLPPVLKWTASPYIEERTDVDQLRAEITTIEQQQRAFERAAVKIEGLVGERGRISKDLPDTLPAPADTRALKREIRALEDAQAAAAAARTKEEVLWAERENLVGRLVGANNALDDHPAVDLAALEAAAGAARMALAPAQQSVMDAQRGLNAARQARVDAVAAYERAKAAITAAQASLEARQQELRTLRFNNKLLKDVRAARPIIADKLWNMVLAAVSLYFSEMRGKPSVVTKGQDGFMVDGVVVSTVSLSGSALDILGLAIRVALVKTFLPACPFFVLDEPAQGCDDNRTANLLSFLSACGFAQVLLVTHEDTSESVAQNMITIGA